jgi:hypothetical protein
MASLFDKKLNERIVRHYLFDFYFYYNFYCRFFNKLYCLIN